MNVLTCLSDYGEIEYRFVLDGDRKKIVEEKSKNDPDIKTKTILLGEESEELEDLFDREFYLECVLDCYKDIFIGEPEKFKAVKQVIKEIREHPPENKITKVVNEKFQNAGLGGFSKVDIAICIKRRFKRGKIKEEHISRLLDYLSELTK